LERGSRSTLILTGQRGVADRLDAVVNPDFLGLGLVRTPTSTVTSTTMASIVVTGDKVAFEVSSTLAVAPACSMNMPLMTPMAIKATIPARFMSLPPPSALVCARHPIALGTNVDSCLSELA